MSVHVSPEEVKEAQDILARLLGDRFTVEKKIGEGGAGLTFKIVEVGVKAIRVAKVMRPTVLRERPDLQPGFEDEAKKLATLRHPNLVQVFERAQLGQHPFYIMEYIEGKTIDEAMVELVSRFPAGRWISEVRDIFLHLVDVVAYLHSRGILHHDIKPANVLLTFDYRHKTVPILLDFGIARFAQDLTGGERKVIALGTLDMWPKSHRIRRKSEGGTGRTQFVIEERFLNEALDLHLLGQTFSLILDAAEEADAATRTKWDNATKEEIRFYRDAIRRLNLDEEAPRFADALSLRLAIRRLELRASRTRYHFDDGFVKAPGHRIGSFGSKVRRLTDWPRFQRLEWIHQLGISSLVYPGVRHSRREHSLGAFENAIAMLDQVSGTQGDPRFRAVVSDEELVATALVALYHDIGHYPFAHQFRVEGAFERHEHRTLEVMRSDEVTERVRESFNDDVHSAMVTLMEALVAHEEARATGRAVPLPDHYRVLRAIVSSPIDCDKLDYVIRDSIHAGVPYGTVVDRDRFISSLRVWWEEDIPHLVLSDKGRVCAEALVFARYAMFSELYWNHGVRAFSAMMSAAIRQREVEEVRKHMWDTDAEFLGWLFSDVRTKWFEQLVSARRPYRRVFVQQALSRDMPGNDIEKGLFAVLEAVAAGDKEKERGIRRSTEKALGISIRNDTDLVVDVPYGVTDVGSAQVLPEGHDCPGPVGPIFDAIASNFDGCARKARIFLHPDLAGQRSVGESTKAVRKELIRTFSLA